MKIQTKKSKTDSLHVSEIYSNHLHKSYCFETGNKGIVIIRNDIIRAFRDKTLKDKKEMQQAWELLYLLKRCVIDFESMYNFNFYIEDGLIKITVGGDCAYIKNNYQEYEGYLNRLELLGTESHIEFEIELKGNKSKIKNGEFNSSIAQKINDIALDAYYKRLHETELDLLINLLTKVKNKEVKDASELTNSICQIVKTI